MTPQARDATIQHFSMLQGFLGLLATLTPAFQ